MESLLRWSIENSTPSTSTAATSTSTATTSDGTPAPPPAPRKDLDPAIIDAILGRSDAELMREALGAALDVEGGRGEEERVGALDDLEMVCVFFTRGICFVR